MASSAETSTKTLKIKGILDAGQVPELRRTLLAGFAQAGSVELDLSQVEGCDAVGLQVLLSARATAERSGKPLRLTSLSPAVKEAAASLGWWWE